MIILNTPVKNATSNVTDQVVTIDIIYRIFGSLMDESIICNVCRTNPTVIIIIVQYTIRICLSGGFCPGGFVRGVLSGGFCPGGGVYPGGFVRGVLSGGVLSGVVLSEGGFFFRGGGLCPGGFARGILSRGLLSGRVLSRGFYPWGF